MGLGLISKHHSYPAEYLIFISILFAQALSHGLLAPEIANYPIR